MDLRQLQYFKAAFECRAMSAAARDCHVTQPTLSAQIKRLELELGEILFGRTAIGLDPTPFADDLYRTLGPVLDKAADGLRVIRSTTGSAPKAQGSKIRPAALPNTRQLRYFVQTFEDGGMSRAASRLNVVQPAISMQIRALEKHLGGTLFERTRTGIYPTDLGRKAYAIYAPLLDELKSAQRRHPRGAKRPGPMLRVGILPGLDEDSLLVRATTATILEWGKAFSNIELKVVESHSGVLLDWLSDNVIDVAIVEDMHARASLRETVLSSEPLAILTSMSYSAHPPGPIRLNEIGNLNLVLPSKRHGLRALMDRAFMNAGLSLVPKLELDSMASAMRLVKSGGWATVMPPSAVQRSIDDKLLVAHPIVRPSVTRELRAVQLPRRRNQTWEATFIRLLRERLRAGDCV
jgi:DNA-binding transcriptional LysR family regulator